MKSLNFILLATIISIISGGCTEKTNKNSPIEVIKVNPHKVTEYINLSEIADSIKCIKLQTASDDVMGRVLEIVIKKKYIYAMDISQGVIFVFDKNGKFISKLAKKGEGPDEYLHMGPMFIDENEEYIELVSYRGKNSVLLKYSNISFDLIESNPFPKVNFSSCKRNDDFYYFATQQQDNTINDQKTNADLIVFNNESELKTMFDKNIETNNKYFSTNEECFATNNQNELFISFMYNKTFYQLKAGKAYPIFAVDFEKYGMPNSIGLESTTKQMKYIKERSGLASFPVLNMNDAKIMAFSYYFKENSNNKMYREEDFRQYIKIKKSNKVYHTKKIKNDITNFPDHIYISSYFGGCNHEVWYEDYLVDIVLPGNYFMRNDTEKVFVEGVGEITIDDDPIIVMMKMKK